MSTDYRIDILTAAGVKRAEVTDFLDLAYTRRVNAPGLLNFTLSGEHAAIAELEDKSQIIVYRRNTAMGLSWTADFWGLYRAQQRSYSDRDLFRARCPGILTMLGWRQVAWYAGTANRSTFSAVAAETIVKTLVSYNAANSAIVANGRLREGAITGLSVQLDGGAGNTLSLSCAYRNLLTALQEIAPIAGGDFDLVKTGAATWEFRWYIGQLGTDRTATVVFALGYGNMAEPVYEYDRINECTVAIVGGQGEGGGRAIVARTGPDYAAVNDIEMFVDGRNSSVVAALNADGDAALDASRAREQFKFKILQTPACFYGVHYQLGDLVTARWRDIVAIQKIVAVSIEVTPQGERIDVEIETQ